MEEEKNVMYIYLKCYMYIHLLTYVLSKVVLVVKYYYRVYTYIYLFYVYVCFK